MLTKISSFKKKVSISAPKPDILTGRAAFMQILFSIMATLSALSPGMGLGFPAIVTHWMVEDGTLTEAEVSWFASITAIACPIGCLFASFSCDKIGRKGTLMVTDIISIIQWVLIAFFTHSDSRILVAELMIARVLTGISVGMCLTPSAVYLSEICHPKIRGGLLVLTTFMATVGTLIIYIIENFISNFHVVSIYALGITICATIVCFFVPETPAYLVMSDRVDEARRVLAMLYNVHEYHSKIDDEIVRIQFALAANKADSKNSIWMEFKKPELYKPLLIMLTFMVIVQLSGIYVIYIFAAQFVREAGVTIDEFIATDIIGMVRCVGTLLVGLISDITGRKSIAITSCSGMFLSMTGLALCSFYGTQGTDLSWLPTLLLVFFCLVGTVGVLTLPFSMVGEMFPQKTRGLGVGITLSFSFFLSFFTIKSFSTAFATFGSAAIFAFFAVISLFGVFFSIFILPETKGKTLQQIENYFRS